MQLEKTPEQLDSDAKNEYAKYTRESIIVPAKFNADFNSGEAPKSSMGKKKKKKKKLIIQVQSELAVKQTLEN